MLEALLEQVQAEPATEPRLPAAGNGKKCGVEGCGNEASPLLALRCADCGMAVCEYHAYPWFTQGMGNQIFCPEHKKGSK